jgi:hypothetical protein
MITYDEQFLLMEDGSYILSESDGKILLQPQDFGVSISEGTALTEALRFAISTPITETLGLNESIAKVWIAIKSISETLGLSEAVSKISTFTKSISETLGLSETVSKLTVFSVSISETLGLVSSWFGDWWEQIKKNTASWTEKSKNTAVWTETSKNDSSWTEKSKNETNRKL